jgi:hypothetical protein
MVAQRFTFLASNTLGTICANVEVATINKTRESRAYFFKAGSLVFKYRFEGKHREYFLMQSRYLC